MVGLLLFLEGMLLTKKIDIKRKIPAMWLLLCLGLRGVVAQDPSFSLVYAQRMYEVPAFAGMDEGRMALGFRDSYPGSDAMFITTFASWDQHLEVLHGGYGVTVMHDRTAGGMLASSALTAVYSYHLQLTRDLFLNSGFSVSLMQNCFDAGDVVLPGMIPQGGGALLPPDELIRSESHFFPDFGVSFLMYGRRWTAAAQATHLMEPYRFAQKREETTLPRKYLFILSYAFPANNDWSFYTSLTTQWQHRSSLYGVSGQASYRNVSAGVGWKKNFGQRYDAAVLYVGMNKGKISFRYALDMMLRSGIGTSKGNAHEVALVLLTGRTKKRGHQTIFLPPF